MLGKIIVYLDAPALFLRAGYLISTDVTSHGRLIRIERVFVGEGNEGVRNTFEVARDARSMDGKRGPQRAAFFEIIFSSPEGAFIDFEEAKKLALAIVDGLRAKYAIFGFHWHEDGRLDGHALVPNETVFGNALSCESVLISTGRNFRNLEVCVRQFLDRAHNQLNLERQLAGKPHIETMDEVKKRTWYVDDKPIRGHKVHMPQFHSPTPDATMVKAAAVSVTEQSSPKGIDWEYLTGLLPAMYMADDDEWERLKKKREKWFIQDAKGRQQELLLDVRRALEADLKKGDPQATEASELLDFCNRCWLEKAAGIYTEPPHREIDF